jgi:SAM-dependent methyltransferase
MAHPQQIAFCRKIRSFFPEYFRGQRVLDIGSLDVNGNNRYLFEGCEYVGLDLLPGPNVDVACTAHEYTAQKPFDVVISTECLEHDVFYAETLKNAVALLRPGGLLLLTCATTGRPEHGTLRQKPEDAPFLTQIDPEWANYYKVLTVQDVNECLDPQETFSRFGIEVDGHAKDLYFWGIKTG